MNNILEILKNEHNSFAKTISKINTLELKKIEKISKVLIKKINLNKNIFIIGNGGSAAQSQHLSAELQVKYKKKPACIQSSHITEDFMQTMCFRSQHCSSFWGLTRLM